MCTASSVSSRVSVEHSALCQCLRRAVQNSRLVRFWCAPELACSPFRHSCVARLCLDGSAAWRVLAACAVLAAVLAYPWLGSGGMIVAMAGAVAFAKPVWGLAALPAALVWTPRFGLLALSGETLYLRLDHGIAAGLILRLATSDTRPSNVYAIRDSALYAAFAFYLSASALSVLAGAFRHTLPSPAISLIYLAQPVYLVLIFVAAYSLGRRLGPWAVYAWGLAIISVGAYGIAESIWPLPAIEGATYRTFERAVFHRQANHFAGLFAFATPVGIALARTPRWRVLGLGLALVSCAALVGTRSREGALALAVGMGVLLVLWLPRYRWVAAAGLLALLFVPRDTWHELVAPGSSMAHRFSMWKGALSTLDAHPLLGLGTGARHRSAYDNHYVMLLAENGALGLGLFLIALAHLARALFQRSRAMRCNVLCTGCLAGLAGIAVQGMAAICFYVTVIAGPLFWLCGCALAIEEAPE